MANDPQNEVTMDPERDQEIAELRNRIQTLEAQAWLWGLVDREEESRRGVSAEWG